MSERRGLWSPLYSPAIYEAFHHLIGARRWLRRFANDVIRARIPFPHSICIMHATRASA
jgi:hypothetical protein